MSGIVPGAILAGKYRVIRILGQGGMGMVVEAMHNQLQERVALKFLLPELANKPEFAERFLREARAAVRIKSEHVARVTDVGTLENGAPFMVMEYLQGGDLAGHLVQNGPMALHDAVDFVIQAAEALADAHAQSVVHRDIKPANLFLTRHGDGTPLVKVLDFGISKVMGELDGLTKTSTTMGSALYMSPEQMRTAKSVDHRADIYSLGVTLYELLVGTQPYCATTLPELCALVLTGTPTPLRTARPDLPEHFAQVLEKSYARERDERFQSIAEFVFALAPYAAPRSQPTIDQIARRANQAGPRAGMLPSDRPPAPMGSGPQGQQPAIGLTNATFSRTAPPKSSKAPLVAALLAVLAVAGAAGGYFLFLRTPTGSASGQPAEGSASDSSSGDGISDDVASAAPADEASAATAATAVPEPAASGSAAADVEGAPSASAEPSKSTPPIANNGRPKRPNPPAGPVATSKPTATPPSNDAFNRR